MKMKQLVLAAESGDPAAQFNLGVLYGNSIDGNGDAISPNRSESMKWLRKAAEHGMPRAQSRLAELYAEPPATPQGDVSACAWFIIAAASLAGIYRQHANSGYERVAARMSADQVAKARRRARLWNPEAMA